MAEIIEEPSALSKIIPVSFKINDTDSVTTTRLATKKQFNTTDTDAWLSFTLDGIDANMTGEFDITMVNVDENPSSIINRTNLPFSAIPFHYKIDASADVEKNQIRHAGRWIGQVIIRLANGDTTTRQFDFAIVGHLLDGKEARLILIEDYNALMATISESKQALDQYNVDYAVLLADITDAEALRVQEYNALLAAQQANIEAFDVALDQGIVAENLAEKLQNFEATNNSRLLSAEQQLEQVVTNKADESDLAVERSRIDLFITPNGDATLAELADNRVDASGVKHPSSGSSLRFAQKGRLVDYDELAMSIGYKRYIPLAFEQGGITYTNGNDAVSISSVRTPSTSKIPFSGEITLFNSNPSVYRWRWIIYNSDGSYNGFLSWNTSAQTSLIPDVALLYRFELGRIDGAQIVMSDVLKAIKVVYEADATDNIASLKNQINIVGAGKNINYSKTAMSYGFNSYMETEFELNGISPTNGNDTVSTSSIRTPYDSKLSFDDNVVIINNDPIKYRVKYVTYTDQTTMSSGGSWQSVAKLTLVADPTKLYRFQIATVDGSVINMADALETLLFFHESNRAALPSITDDKFLQIQGGKTGDTVNYIPDYWQDYLDERIAYIRTLLADGSSKTAFITTTDTHYNPSNVNNINPAIPKYLAEKLNLNLLLHLGDLSAENSIKATAIELHETVTRYLKNAVDNYLPIRGNHDDNLQTGYAFNLGITQAEHYSWTFRTLKNVHFGHTGTYYYQDNEFEKVRYIGLDCIDFIYQDSGDGTLDEKMLIWGYEQLNWFVNTALNVPSGYSIVIMNHAGIVDTFVTQAVGIETSKQTKVLNANVMIDILRAYKNRAQLNLTMSYPSSVNPSYYAGTLNKDFSTAQGTIVGFFSGHEHIDDQQLISDTGIYNIYTLNNSVNFGTEIPSHAYQPAKNIGEISEEVYDVVVIDRKTKNVKMVRIGAGLLAERTFSYT